MVTPLSQSFIILSYKMTSKGDGSNNGKNNEVQLADSRLQYAVESWIGCKIKNEDEWCIMMCSSYIKWVGAIYDGHGGGDVSEYCQKHLLSSIIRSWEKSNKNLLSHIYTNFLDCDNNIRADETINSNTDGSTAVIAFVTEDCVIFANCGDSRGMFCVGERVIVTEDHKPNTNTERDRILRSGENLEFGCIDGSLDVSRGLGDFYYKSNSRLSATDQAVSPEPHIYTYPRSIEDEFLIIASDGLWKNMSNERVISLIRHELYNQSSISDICEKLMEHCKELGCRDDITVIIVVF